MSDLLAMWSAAALAGLFAGWRFWRLVSAHVNVAAATSWVAKLVAADNLQRAIKLCQAAPRSVYLVAVREALTAPDRAQGRFDAAFARAMAPLEATRWMDLAAFSAGVIALLIAATSEVSALLALPVAGVASAAALFNLRAMRRLRRDPLRAFPTIRDALAGLAPAPPAAKSLDDLFADPAPSAPAEPAAAAGSGAGTPVAPPAPAKNKPLGATIDLRDGACPLCHGTRIDQRSALAGEFTAWVCQDCGYAQLFAPV